MPKSNEVEPKYDWRYDPWLNLGYKVPVTSLAASLIATPFNAWMMHLQKPAAIEQGKPKPISKVRGSNFFLTLSFFTRGIRAQVISGQQRGAVSIAAKKTTEDDEAQKKNFSLLNPLSITVFFSQLDVIASQYHTNRAKLEAAGIIDKKTFKVSSNSIKQLVMMGYPYRGMANLIHFTALCFLSDKCRDFYGHDRTGSAFFGGALAGATATLFASPFSSAMDQVVLGTKVSSGSGEIIRLTTISFLKQLNKSIERQGIRTFLYQLAIQARVQLPARMLFNASVFSAILGVDGLLGPRPLASIPKCERV